MNHQHPPRELVRLQHVFRRKEQVAQRVAHAHRLARAEGATDRREMFEPERGLVSDLLDDIGYGREAGGLASAKAPQNPHRGGSRVGQCPLAHRITPATGGIATSAPYTLNDRSPFGTPSPTPPLFPAADISPDPPPRGVDVAGHPNTSSCPAIAFSRHRRPLCRICERASSRSSRDRTTASCERVKRARWAPRPCPERKMDEGSPP